MEQTVGQRVKVFIDSLKMSVNEFSKHIGLERPDNLYNLIDGTVKKSTTVLDLITNKFENINSEWLYTGKGEMLKNRENRVDFYSVSFSEKEIRELIAKKDYLQDLLNNRLIEDNEHLKTIIDLQKQIDELKDRYERNQK